MLLIDSFALKDGNVYKYEWKTLTNLPGTYSTG